MSLPKIRNYGPSLVLAAVVLGSLLLGPTVMRELAWAQQDEQISIARQKLSEHSAGLEQISRAYRMVAQVVEPSVVHVSVKARSNGGPGRGFDLPFPFDIPQDDMEEYDEPRMAGQGSGWVWDSEGHIITNAHVILPALDPEAVRSGSVEMTGEVVVRFSDRSTRDATIVGVDTRTDIAVLKVSGERLHPLTVSEEDVQQGDMVFAFGSPFGIQSSMSQGIVSGVDRQLGITNGGYEEFIQTDAAINPGNSGGPLTNIHGEVVGMNSAIATRTGGFSGLGFAIPTHMINNVVPQLIKSGQVARGYLGVIISDETQLLRSFGYEGQAVIVDDVLPDSPAAEAGLKRGDIITHLNGEPMLSVPQLRNNVSMQGPDKTVELTVVRNGESSKVEVTLAPLPRDNQLASGPRPVRPDRDDESQNMGEAREILQKLGFQRMVSVTDSVAQRFGVENIEGVLVLRVRPGSVAGNSALSMGRAIITHVYETRVSSVGDFVDAVLEHQDEAVLRLTARVGDRNTFILLEMP